jgi:tRNA (cytidine/uridine-2'-O-)-methyltransferase
MRVALFQPDIPQNTGAVLRLAACLGVGVDVIEPSGFVWSDRRMKRAGMDYIEQVDLVRHTSWDTFRAQFGGRLVLLTTQGATPYLDHRFEQTDTLLLGRESAGVPSDVHDTADARIRVPMAAGMRSLNVALAAAMVLSEALRQTYGFTSN